MVLLTVDFRTDALWPTPVDFGTRTGYKISAESAMDGAKTACWNEAARPRGRAPHARWRPSAAGAHRAVSTRGPPVSR